AAMLWLKDQGYTNIKVSMRRQMPSFLLFFSKNKVNSMDVTVFTRMLATMQSSGIPLVQALKVVIDSTEKRNVVKLISQLKHEVESGNSLSEAIRNHPNEFDTLYCNL